MLNKLINNKLLNIKNGKKCLLPLKFISSAPGECEYKEAKINLDGVNINYLKLGSSNGIPLMLLPGALGTIWTDFKPQIEYFNKQNISVVAWDPPGYGKSRPPDRVFTENFYHKDAEWAQKLMQSLGYSKFSILGWSDGGITSLIMAAKYPDNIHKIIVCGANAYIAPKEMIMYEKIKNIDSWSERMKAPMIAIYGEKYFQQLWSNWVDTMKKIFENQNGDLCKSCLPMINCPTLIVHGAKDQMVLEEHPNYLKSNIKNSSIQIFEKGAHNLHLRYHEEFNKLVTNFLKE